MGLILGVSSIFYKLGALEKDTREENQDERIRKKFVTKKHVLNRMIDLLFILIKKMQTCGIKKTKAYR